MVQVFVVSVYSHFTNELVSEIVKADGVWDAFFMCGLTRDWVDTLPDRNPEATEDESLEFLKQHMFDNDHSVNIIRID